MRGYYIAEILISLVLGAIIVASLLSLTFAGWKTYLTITSYSSTSDLTRVAFSFLDSQLSLAGYRAKAWELSGNVFPALPASAGNYPAFAAGQTLSAQDVGGNTVLYIRKQGGLQNDSYNAGTGIFTPPAYDLIADTRIRDCTGSFIPNQAIIIEKYSINATNQLVCQRVYVRPFDASVPTYIAVTAANSSVIMEYVVAARARFGVGDIVGDRDTAGLPPARRTAAQITSPTNRWSSVMSVEYGLVVGKFDDKNLSNKTDRTVKLFGRTIAVRPTRGSPGNYATAFTQIITLRNRMY